MARKITKTKIQKKQIDTHITSFKRGQNEWINVTNVNKEIANKLAEKYGILDEDLIDTLPPLQRSKLLARKDYIFAILVFPLEDKETNTIQATEVDFFIFKHTLITLHHNKLEPLKNFPTDLAANELSNLFISSFSPAHLVNHILTHLYEYSLPLSNRLGNEIDLIEEKVYRGGLAEKTLVEEVFTIDRKIVDFRKIMRTHEMIIQRLIKHLPGMSKTKLPHDLLQDLADLPTSLWTNLESHMEAIDALQSTYESLTSFRLNDIIKTLTIISIVIAPLALIAGIFGMNFKFVPYASHPNGFLLSLILMLIISLISIVFFKYKKWL